MVDKEEVHAIARQILQEHREEVDKKLSENAWTEERAKQVATIAAGIAVQQITDNFYMSVGRKTVATIGATVVILVVAFKDGLRNMVKVWWG